MTQFGPEKYPAAVKRRRCAPIHVSQSTTHGRRSKGLPGTSTPVRLAFRVSYLGSRFFGSQMQAQSRTVEGEFIAACQRLSLFSDWRQAGFLAAGRTDRGVNSRGQVIAFTTDAPDRAIGTVNLQLHRTSGVPRMQKCRQSFTHATMQNPGRTGITFQKSQKKWTRWKKRAGTFWVSTISRTFPGYRIRILSGISLQSRSLEEDGFVFLEVTAESFLWHQVRCMATALLRVGYGESTEESIHQYLQGNVDKPLSPAPAEGLVLWDTDCGVSWLPLPERERSNQFIDHLSRHHALMEKVCRVLKNP